MQTQVLQPNAESIALAAEIFRAGGLVGFPTETVYGLGADATNADAARAIFAAKGRPGDNPLIVHISQMEQLSLVVSDIPERARALMEAFWPGPLTLILPKSARIPSAVTAGLDTVAVRFPAHAVAQEIITRTGLPIAAPSANLSGRPSTTTAAHVFSDLNGRIPLIIDGGPCQVGLESTVVDATGERVVLLRPGGVTREMMEAVLGERVEIGKGVMEPLGEGDKALSPGLKHKHYAPKAQVAVVLGGQEERARYILKAAQADDRPCVLCLEAHKDAYPGLDILSAGDTPKDYAHNLFAALRQADEAGYTKIYAEGLSTAGVGLAVMNRIERAAGFDLIKLTQGEDER